MMMVMMMKMVGNGAFQSDAFRARSKAMRFLRVPKRGPYLGNCDIVKSKPWLWEKLYVCSGFKTRPPPVGHGQSSW